jgi:cyclopropane fatty-acyl-phospholipid synthase-like methyltransferase
VTEADKLLEVSCGLGVGSSLVMTEFNPKEIHGIDISQAQISRAKKINSEVLQKYPSRIFLDVGAAEAIPYCSENFEKIFSIEAAQHFENLERFVEEVNRVLKPGGRLAITTFFGTSNESHALLSTTIPTIRDGIDKATPIYEFEELLKKNGFTNIKIENIGKNVWHGFDQWVAQGDLSKSWTRNWYKWYQKGFIDYFLITADKPE